MLVEQLERMNEVAERSDATTEDVQEIADLEDEGLTRRHGAEDERKNEKRRHSG